jgi:hypothetical protein
MRASAGTNVEMINALRNAKSPTMTKFVFILGAPNGNDGKLSSVSLRRVEAAIERQRNEPDVVGQPVQMPMSPPDRWPLSIQFADWWPHHRANG